MLTKIQLMRIYQQLVPKRKKGINLKAMKADDIIRLIQKEEGNAQCFKGSFSRQCGHNHCMWFERCVN